MEAQQGRAQDEDRVSRETRRLGDDQDAGHELDGDRHVQDRGDEEARAVADEARAERGPDHHDGHASPPVGPRRLLHASAEGGL
ncbi:MAG: hypothetical protein ACK56I_28645, partial [bacterium]